MLAGKRSESTKHKTDERQEDEGFGSLGQEVIFPVQATIKGEPGEAAFYNPALLDDHEAPVALERLALGVRQFLAFGEPIPSGIGIGSLHNLYRVA